MKNILCILISFFVILFAFSVPSLAQKKVKGRPVDFSNPIDYFYEESQYNQFLVNTVIKEKDKAWLVFSDRDDNKVYEGPSYNSKVVSEIHLREYFYVVDETDGWIKIIKARVDGLKIVDPATQNFNDSDDLYIRGNEKKSTMKAGEMGWVAKKNMLLWNSGIIGKITGIHKKVLLMNRADNINEVLDKFKKEKVKIYKGPYTSDTIPDRNIFEFYFVLKEENGRYLLSEEVNVSTYEPEKIIGWVNARDCTVWNTRICLEPNYEEEAFRERRENPNLQIKAVFGPPENAVALSKGKAIANEKILWEKDPVKQDIIKMSKSNPRRFNGNVLRFPMVNVVFRDNVEVYETGLVGDVVLVDKNKRKSKSEVILSQLKKELNEERNRLSRANVFFVIEGTDSVHAYKPTIINSIHEISRDLQGQFFELKFGALVYRDILEEDASIGGKGVNRLFEYTKLTQDVQRVTNFIEETYFFNVKDRDKYTSMYYGIQQALQFGGFRKDELNIIIVVGCYGDFKVDITGRAEAAKGHPALFDEKDLERLIANLSELKAHLYGIQLRNDGFRTSRSFVGGIHYLTVESAKYAYNTRYGGKQFGARNLVDSLGDYGWLIDQPEMDLSGNTKEAPLKSARGAGAIFRPVSMPNLTLDELRSSIIGCIQRTVQYSSDMKLILRGMGQGQGLTSDLRTAGEIYDAAVADIIYEIKRANPDLELEDFMSEQYALFNECYIPYKIEGARHPLVSYVLFMPESDLLSYINILEGARGRLADLHSSVEKRKELFEVYKSLVEQFTGGKKLGDLTREDLVLLMQGVYKTGLKIDVQLDYKIKDIQDERLVSDAEVESTILRFIEVEKKLKEILRDPYFEYAYDTGLEGEASEKNRYYWIPLKDVF